MSAKCIVKLEGENLPNINKFYYTVKILYVYFIYYFISMEKVWSGLYRLHGGAGAGISKWKQILEYFFGHKLYIGK